MADPQPKPATKTRFLTDRLSQFAHEAWGYELNGPEVGWHIEQELNRLGFTIKRRVFTKAWWRWQFRMFNEGRTSAERFGDG